MDRLLWRAKAVGPERSADGSMSFHARRTPHRFTPAEPPIPPPVFVSDLEPLGSEELGIESVPFILETRAIETTRT